MKRGGGIRGLYREIRNAKCGTNLKVTPKSISEDSVNEVKKLSVQREKLGVSLNMVGEYE